MPAAPVATLSSAAYDQLRREIIQAVLLPGQRLHIAQLCERYDIGLSPMREALHKLARDGLVTHNEQRGFLVTPVSEAHLDELTRTRGWLNELALRESIAHGDAAWEEQVVLAYHRLSRLTRGAPAAAGPAGEIRPDWEEAHRAFHSSLNTACRSSWLIGYCDQLFDAADRYRHLSRMTSRRDVVRVGDEHRVLMEAAVERRADAAVRLLHEHLNGTAELVRSSLRELEGREEPPGARLPVSARGPRAPARRRA